MRLHAEPFTVAHPVDGAFQLRALERTDHAAPFTDQVVVMRAVRRRGFEPRDAVAELDPGHGSDGNELIEHPVHRREAHALPRRADRIVHLLGGRAAIACRKLRDDGAAGSPAPVAGRAQRGLGMAGPGARRLVVVSPSGAHVAAP